MAPSYSGTQKTYLPDLTQPSSQGSFPLPGTASTSTSASSHSWHTPTLTPPVAPPPAAPPRCLLVFNKASLPSSFPDPLLDSFLVNSINHHQRLSKPTTRSLSSLLTSPNSLRKSSSTPVTRFFYWCFGFSTTPSSSFQPTIPFPQYLGVFSRFPLWIVNKGTIALVQRPIDQIRTRTTLKRTPRPRT